MSPGSVNGRAGGLCEHGRQISGTCLALPRPAYVRAVNLVTVVTAENDLPIVLQSHVDLNALSIPGHPEAQRGRCAAPQ